MVIALYLLAVLVPAALMILAAPLEIGLKYSREGSNGLLGLDLYVGPFSARRYRIFTVVMKAKPAGAGLRRRRSSAVKRGGGTDGEIGKETLLSGIGRAAGRFFFWREVYSRARPSLNYFKGKVRITDLDWRTRIGLGDPFHTGMATGMIWSLKGFLVSLLFSQIRAAKIPALAVVPDFNRACLATRIDLKIAARTGHILITVVWILMVLAVRGLACQVIKVAAELNRNKSNTGEPA